MTALYVQAALVLAISILAFALVTRIAWPSNVYLFRLFRAWCRGVPERWKRFRDPAYRRRQERIDEYLGAFGGLVTVRLEREQLARAKQQAGNEGIVRAIDRMLEDADARCEGMQMIAIEVMRRLDAEAIADIADRLSVECFGGAVPASELGAFLEEERALVLATPHLAADHVRRLTLRFGRQRA